MNQNEMDETSIYSCDDHLDLRAVPAPVCGSHRLPKALVERGPRVVTGEGDPMWVCNDRVLGRSGLPAGDKLQALSALEPRRPRGRRLPGQRSEAAVGGHGPRRGVGLGHLRSHPTDAVDPRAGPADRLLCGMERLGHRGVQRIRTGPVVRPPVPAQSFARGRGGRARAGRRPGPPGCDHRRVRVRRRRSGLGSPVGGGRADADCPSASTSKKAHPRGCATRWASGSRRRSPPSFPSSSTRRWPSWSSPGRSSGTPDSPWCWPRRGSGGCRTS